MAVETGTCLHHIFMGFEDVNTGNCSHAEPFLKVTC